MATFHERLNEMVDARAKEKGITKKAIADEIGVSQTAFSNYLRGKRTPQGSTLKLFATYFKVSTDYIQGISDIPSIDLTIREICSRTGLSQKALECLMKLQLCNAAVSNTTAESNAISRIIEEYADTKEPETTALHNIVRLLNIPRAQKIGDVCVIVERNGRRETSYSAQADGVKYLETVFSERISESLIKISRGEKKQ